MDEARVKAFRALKPPCVELSQVALRYKAKKATTKDIIKPLESLHETMSLISGQSNALDSKLADYAFFPLSHIFRDSKDLPVRAVEVALQCLQILISQGWRSQLSSELGKQILILLCFLAGGSATETKVKHVNEELSATAFECLSSLFQASNGAGLGAKSVDAKDIPVLGHTVTVMLDGVTDGPSVSVRLSALSALNSLVSSITDEEALRGVFPGTVSSLTKVLSSKSGSKPSYKVLVTSLRILSTIICKVIDDGKFGDSETTKIHKGLPELWATATSAQVKMALANIMPLRYHDRSEVREALMQLCNSIIQNSRTALSQSIPMLIETLVVLCSRSRDGAALSSFGTIAATDHDLLDIIKSSLHDWIVALPRVMQSNDETKKTRTLEQISTAFKLLESHDISLDILNDSMAVSLRASVSSAIQASQQTHPISESSLEVSQLLQSTNAASSSAAVFQPVLFSESGNRPMMDRLQKLAVQIHGLPLSTGLLQDIAKTLRTTSEEERLAGMWLALQILNHGFAESAMIDQYLDLPPGQDSPNLLLDDIYSFSLDVLSESTFEDKHGWKLQALALETLALQARNQKEDFRPELVDALYPILERLGSNNAALQQHAMTCLNIVSTTCNYANSSALVIDNADYLVNAVGLKLNTFDISPQVPQVLVMVVRLCGAALIPYLDDSVESLFSILACYHGYPKLVDSIFSVLVAIVEEAAKSSTRGIKSGTDTTTRPKLYKPTTIADLASLLRSNLERTNRPLSPPPSPRSSKEPLSQKDFEPQKDSEDSPEAPTDPPTPAPSKTHTLLTSITNLTPSHLTTPSPPIRAHILNLLTTALPILASNTDTFLPIAAQLYSPITTRLYDPEAYTTLAAANALATLCECAGDFLLTRMESEWDKLLELYKRVERDMREETRIHSRGKGNGKGLRGTKWRVWDAVVQLLLAVVTNVGVNENMEDGVFEALGGLAGERQDVRSVLEDLNADALWLLEEKARGSEGEQDKLVKPEGVNGREFADISF
ncbi:armadillo-type protein [Usnea florida]